MKKVLLIRYGELSLKGQNRHYFIDTLVSNIRYAIRDIKGPYVSRVSGRVLIENIELEDEAEVIERVKKVFGIVYITKAFQTDVDFELIKEIALSIMKDKTDTTFKVEARRSDKTFFLTSPQIERQVGAYILVNTDSLKVDVHEPEIMLTIEIREKAYIYYENIKCEAGLPLGTGGRGLALLSGGIDSPVACYMMEKRGMKITAVHFHSYPFTSMDAKEKVVELSKKISCYNMGINLYCISLTHIQEEIIKKCDTSYLTVILRRFMLKCAAKLANDLGIPAIITGESLGQVASQTIESIYCTDMAVNLPILRPLIAIDKNDTIKIAEKIGTYDISILPYEDCCTLFVPKHPQTKPALEKVLLQEEKLDCEALIAEAMESVEKIKL